MYLVMSYPSENCSPYLSLNFKRVKKLVITGTTESISKHLIFNICKNIFLHIFYLIFSIINYKHLKVYPPNFHSFYVIIEYPSSVVNIPLKI